MGFELVTFKVYAKVSRHNSEDDDIDDALWEGLFQRVQAICQDPIYESIDPQTG
jgi:hypothetical protein